MYRKTSLLILAAATLVACTVGRDWSTYRIRVVTDPKGAECYFERDGVITQAPEPTPVDLTMTSISRPASDGRHGGHRDCRPRTPSFRGGHGRA